MSKYPNIAKTLKLPFIINEMKNLFLSKKHNYFSIAYSGGKDSSTMMILFLEMINSLKNEEIKELNKKHIFIINSDTGIEIPAYQLLVEKNLNALECFFKNKNLNIQIKRVKPELKNTYFSLIIGKGYTLPRSDYRWCSQRLKIMPNDKIFNELFNSANVVVLTGLRKDESSVREKKLEKNQIEGFLKTNDYNINKLLFTPIENLKTKDVWELIDKYMDKYNSLLGLKELKELYIIGSKRKDTIDTRFGCMYCPMINRDYTLENISKKLFYLKPVLRFRNWLVQFQYSWSERDYYNHKNYKMNRYTLKNHRYGMISPAGYSIEFRKTILEKLLRTEKLVNKLYQVYMYGKVKNTSLKDIKLISDEELAYIQDKWVEEGDLAFMVKRIANEYGRDFTISDYAKRIKNIALSFKNDLDEYLPKENRKYTLFAKEFIKSGDYKKAMEKVEKMDFLKDWEIKIIKKEWREDKISFVRFLEMIENKEINLEEFRDKGSLFEDYGIYQEHKEILDEVRSGMDIIYSDKISLEEKYKYLEGF